MGWDAMRAAVQRVKLCRLLRSSIFTMLLGLLRCFSLLPEYFF